MTDDEVQMIYENLHENYEYRGGKLIIKKWVSGRSKRNLQAGYFHLPTNKGRVTERLRLNLDGKIRSLNLDRAIFCYHYKKIPQCIEHINGNPVDHKIENLKESNSYVINNKNITSWKGVKTYQGKNGTRYYPYLYSEGKHKTLGGYDNFDDAHAAYLKAKEQIK